MLEVLGRPPEHLKETLKELIKQIGEEKGVEVKSHEIHEPIELKENKNLYTSFADVDVETDGVVEILRLTFKYMPSHIEIVSPENITITNNFLNETFNELTRRLHAYDDIARILQNEKIILENQLKGLTEKVPKKKKSSK
jgi:hypothetical protein